MEAILIVWFFFAVIVGFVANDRGRSGFGFFLLSLIISPLLVGIILLVMPDLAKAARQDEERAKAEERRAAEQRQEHEKQLEALRALKTDAPSSTSTADELTKLAALLKEGVLTQAEFDDQKRRLLQA
jgi:uncharacterized membrane protein